MSTRSRIGMEMADGSVKSIYCHFDGYISSNGVILLKNYKDQEKVESLIDLGDISILGGEVVPSDPSHSFDSRQRGVTVAYHRDRGEDYRKPRVNKSVPDFFNSDIEEYGYLFTQEGQWLVKSIHREDLDPMTIENFKLAIA